MEENSEGKDVKYVMVASWGSKDWVSHDDLKNTLGASGKETGVRLYWTHSIWGLSKQ